MKTINDYKHLSINQFMDEVNLLQLCPDELQLEICSCIHKGTNKEECDKCWENAIKDIEFNNSLVQFESEHLMTLTHLAQIEKQFKDMDKERKELKNKLLESMERYGVDKFENNNFTMSRTKETTYKTFDKKSFMNDYPKLYNQYLVETTRSSSITFKLRG